MSHATVAVSPAVQALMSTLLPAVAVGAAGFAVTAGAIAAAKKLRCDFEQARTDLEVRCREDEFAHLEIARRQGDMAIGASAFGALMEAGQENATVAFIQASFNELSAIAEEAGLFERSVQARSSAQSVDASTAEEGLRRYFAMSDQLTAELDAAGHNAFQSTFASLRSEIESAFSDPSCERIRSTLIGSLAKLEAVGEGNEGMARQGIENLRSRVRREITSQLERSQIEVADRRRRRELVVDTFAMLRAVVSAEGDPDEKATANSLLLELGRAFQQGAAPAITELEALFAKTRVLFEKCEKRLEEVAARAYVAESVKDVLLNMGYQVSEVPAEVENGDPGCLVSIDGDSGVVVSVARDGRMLTEMVAFTPNGQNPDAEAEQRVCSLVDDILAGLRRREIGMLEKSRKKLRPGHRLRTVKRAKVAEALTVVTPKARTIE